MGSRTMLSAQLGCNSADFAQMLTKALAKCSYERTDIERRTEAAMLKNKELADYIMDQLSELGDIRNIPMMGGSRTVNRNHRMKVQSLCCR